MSKLDIVISDWGARSSPMMIINGDETVSLELHPVTSRALDQCSEYAGKRVGAENFHLGFYGYLRVCDAFCTQQTGVSIFDLADTTCVIITMNGFHRTEPSSVRSKRRGIQSPRRRNSNKNAYRTTW
jgi:hypothetical protein